MIAMEEIKQKIKEYRDYWGLEIHYQDEIDNATTYSELGDVLNKYHKHIEDMANDAQKDLSGFRKRIGLDDKIMEEI